MSPDIVECALGRRWSHPWEPLSYRCVRYKQVRNVDLNQAGIILIKYTLSQLEMKMTIGMSDSGMKGSFYQKQCTWSELENSSKCSCFSPTLGERCWFQDTKFVSHEREECPLFPEEHTHCWLKNKKFKSFSQQDRPCEDVYDPLCGNRFLIENRLALARHWVMACFWCAQFGSNHPQCP